MEDTQVDISWDLNSVNFSCGLEPLKGYYMAIPYNKDTILLLGYITHGAYSKNKYPPPLTSEPCYPKKNHTFGMKLFATKEQLDSHNGIYKMVI
eukprot:Gb_37030 [translate_table: standard]